MFEAVELAEAARKAAGAEVALASDGELCDAVRELAAARAAVAAAEAHVLAELDRRGVTDREFGQPTLWWVTAQTRAPRPAVAALLRLGTRLRQLPGVDEALRAGDLTVDHARVVGDALANPRVAEAVIELHHELVEQARTLRFEPWRRHVARLVELLDQDGGFDPDRALARNQLQVQRSGADGVTLSGELVGEQALGFIHLLDTETDRLWRRARRDHDHTPELPLPSRATLRALALVELVRKGAAGAAPAGSGPIVDISLIRGSDDAVDRGQAHLVCDAAVTPVLVDDTGVPLAVGRTRRHATPAQRRALAVRDRGCVFPGCDMPVGWCDAHHVTPWDDDGPTDLPNLALLCRHHHGVTHRRGWVMTAHPDQTFTWTTPTGRTLTSQRQRGSPTLAA